MANNTINGSITNYSSLTGKVEQKTKFSGAITSGSKLSGSIMATVLKGLSAYEIAVKNGGYTGTIEEWLESLVGNGIKSTKLNDNYTLTIEFTDGSSYTTPSIRGEKGENGDFESDYELIHNKPKIENVEISGNRTLHDFGVDPISTDDLLEILK